MAAFLASLALLWLDLDAMRVTVSNKTISGGSNLELTVRYLTGLRPVKIHADPEFQRFFRF